MSTPVVSSGSIPLSSATVSSGDALTVNSGTLAVAMVVDGGLMTVFGTANATTVEQGGTLTVSASTNSNSSFFSGTASGSIIGSGGEMVVGSGAAAASTTVQNGGTYVVLGSATGVAVAGGGLLLVNGNDDGGVVSTISVASGGAAVAFSGTSLLGLTVDGGGHVIELPGATVVGGGSVVSTGVAIIEPTGSVVVSAGPVGSSVTLTSGATELVLPGGIASSGLVGSGANQQVFAGGSALGMVLSDSFQTINSGGYASGTEVDQGAVEYVFSKGSATRTTVNNGFVIVNSGGKATHVVVNSGGNASVDGTSEEAEIGSGGGEYVYVDGTALNTQIDSGGYAYVFGAAFGTDIQSGGYEVIANGLGTLNGGSGGIEIGETVENGGVLVVHGQNGSAGVSGGITSSGTIASGGIELLFSGAVDIGTTVQSGGIYIPLQGASSSSLTVDAGGTVVSTGVVLVESPATVSLFGAPFAGQTLGSGMSDYIRFDGTEIATTISNHGYSEVDSGGTAIDTIIQGGGVLVVASGGTASGGITFSGSGGTLVLDVPSLSLSGAVVSGFAAGDTIEFNTISGGTPSATIIAGDTLQVTNGAITEDLQLDSNLGGATLVAQSTASGTSVTIAQSSSATPIPSGVTSPVYIPLFSLPNGGGEYKIGIEVSLNGGASYNMYEFDTGGTGFFAAYSPTSWSSYTPLSSTPVNNIYLSGYTYTAQPVSTTITLPTTNGGTLSIANANVGMITWGEDSKTLDPSAQQWNADLTTTPSVPPLEGNFYGDFGMSLSSGSGLSDILSQICGTLSNGFIVTVGPYPSGSLGQIGNVQVGLTQADIDSFTTIVPMQGQSTLNTHANSGQPTYSEVLVNGTLSLYNAGLSPSSSGLLPTGFVYDTGAPSMQVHLGSEITEEDVNSFINGSLYTSTTLTATAPSVVSGGSEWDLSFPIGNDPGSNVVNTTTSDVIGQSSGYVNTGLNAFYGYRIMYDLADGIMGFQALPCFAAGTQIMTPRGAVDIAALQSGDEVITVSGEARPIVWIGHRTVDCRRHPSPQSVLPVRIRAHAFGPSEPQRDLLLSPDHALFLDGALIPIKYLLNGSTVAQVHQAKVTYYHIELSRHDVILAEGLPAETYLETGSRAAFANGGDIVQAYADFGPKGAAQPLGWEANGYAPLIVTGPVVERVRQRLRSRVPANAPATLRAVH